MNHLRQCQKGYVLVDVMLAIVVAAMVIVIPVWYFRTATFNTQVSQAIAQINQLSQASYQWIQMVRQPNFAGISVDVLYQAGLISCKTNNPCTLQNPWGGAVLIYDTTILGHVQFDYRRIPLPACNALTNRLKNIAVYTSGCGSAATVADFYIVI